MGRAKANASPKDYAVAQNLRMGMNRKQACERAGYSKSYSCSFAAKIIASEGVAMALAELGAGTQNHKLGDMAKARLYEDLVKPPKGDKGAKARLGIIRTGLEIAGQLGGPSELHLHQHTTLPPAVQKMLEDKMKEILAVKGVLNGDAISEGTEGRGEDRQDDDGVQARDAELGIEDRTAG